MTYTATAIEAFAAGLKRGGANRGDLAAVSAALLRSAVDLDRNSGDSPVKAPLAEETIPHVLMSVPVEQAVFVHAQMESYRYHKVNNDVTNWPHNNAADAALAAAERLGRSHTARSLHAKRHADRLHHFAHERASHPRWRAVSGMDKDGPGMDDDQGLHPFISKRVGEVGLERAKRVTWAAEHDGQCDLDIWNILEDSIEPPPVAGATVLSSDVSTEPPFWLGQSLHQSLLNRRHELQRDADLAKSQCRLFGKPTDQGPVMQRMLQQRVQERWCDIVSCFTVPCFSPKYLDVDWSEERSCLEVHVRYTGYGAREQHQQVQQAVLAILGDMTEGHGWPVFVSCSQHNL